MLGYLGGNDEFAPVAGLKPGADDDFGFRAFLSFTSDTSGIDDVVNAWEA
jgi:hypothetical protein